MFNLEFPYADPIGNARRLLDVAPKACPSRAESEVKMRLSIHFLVWWIVIIIIGGMVSSVEANTTAKTDFGLAIFWLGIASAACSMLIEFFSIGRNLIAILQILEKNSRKAPG